ncbi:hypothetical protein [Pseudomonas sp. B392_1p]|jgi:hypothetical protein|uniref:hypothetical protein n=1 Tax=Pseudomonas sp. B392_1p TaxID=3457507 RepID=UPI003FD170F4
MEGIDKQNFHNACSGLNLLGVVIHRLARHGLTKFSRRPPYTPSLPQVLRRLPFFFGLFSPSSRLMLTLA